MVLNNFAKLSEEDALTIFSSFISREITWVIWESSKEEFSALARVFFWHVLVNKFVPLNDESQNLSFLSIPTFEDFTSDISAMALEV